METAVEVWSWDGPKRRERPEVDREDRHHPYALGSHFRLMDSTSDEELYPHADIIVPAAEMRHWCNPELLAKVPAFIRPNLERIQRTSAGKIVRWNDGYDFVPLG